MPRQWTEEQKQIQRERCLKHKPWTSSTGARTPEGKSKVSRNAYAAKLFKYYRKNKKQISAEAHKKILELSHIRLRVKEDLFEVQNGIRAILIDFSLDNSQKREYIAELQVLELAIIKNLDDLMIKIQGLNIAPPAK